MKIRIALLLIMCVSGLFTAGVVEAKPQIVSWTIPATDCIVELGWIDNRLGYSTHSTKIEEMDMNRLENCSLKTSLIPPARLIATGDETGVDVSEFQDMVKLVLAAQSVSGSGRTMDIEITDGLTLGGSYASLTPPVTFTQVGTSDSEQEIDLYIDQARPFIRAEVVIAGTSPIFETSLQMIGRTGQE